MSRDLILRTVIIESDDYLIIFSSIECGFLGKLSYILGNDRYSYIVKTCPSDNQTKTSLVKFLSFK
jgi:hypothetical protein